MKSDLKHISKFMSLVLRHQPEKIGLQLDENGWTTTEELISKLNAHGITTDFSVIELVVATNDKKRFSFNESKTKIRANQGHSIDIELNLAPVTPPDILYHGTTSRFLESILKTGLQKQNRQHVHLSADETTAKAVGSRHGKPVILTVKAEEMVNDGRIFFLSENTVWLTDEVPVQYIILPANE
ncbi:MAG: RNA 2'-phosphotransferase [Terrimonas sp.]|nr:RNA 2'-phosphotransferase [Terrimonas sp.]OJY88870.1 MAG: RNA--NAD 2'-phosphotransferase [Sphingobacteriales bacterium 40-81]